MPSRWACRLGKMLKSDDAIYNPFVEPQYSVALSGPGVSVWQVFMAVNKQF